MPINVSEINTALVVGARYFVALIKTVSANIAVDYLITYNGAEDSIKRHDIDFGRQTTAHD